MDHKQIISDCFEEDHNQYKKIFQQNNTFVQNMLEQDSQYFHKLSKGQTPKYLIIGCSDSRVPPNDLTKLKPGDIFNHRNIANQVLTADMNVNSVIQYAVEQLKVQHVVVMGHTHCGGIKAAIEGNSMGGIMDLWLSNVKNVYEKHQDDIDAIEEMSEKVTRLCELNVIEQVKNVWKNPYVQKSWNKGHPVWVHGWIFRVNIFFFIFGWKQTHMPAFLEVFQFNFEDANGAKQLIHAPNDIRQETCQNPVVKKQSIWHFDDFLAVQKELMLQTDITDINMDKFNIHELVQDKDEDEEEITEVEQPVDVQVKL